MWNMDTTKMAHTSDEMSTDNKKGDNQEYQYICGKIVHEHINAWELVRP